MIPTPWPFQLDLFERVRAARARGARIIVVQAPTGAGKTTWAAYTAKRAAEKEKRVLFLVHRRKLVDQISARLIEFEVNHGVIMRGEKPYGSAGVQVASRDTITSRCFTHDWNGLPPADLIFVDEAHRAANEESEHRKILNQYPNATILLLTATPVGPDGRGLGPWAQAIECAAPTSQLVRDGFLCPVKCYAPDRKRGRGGKFKRGIAGDLVLSWIEYAQGLPTVLFCARVQHSLDAVEAFKAAGVSAAHVDAGTSDDDRERLFAELTTGHLKVISNVGILKEGVDIPSLGCCQLYMNVQGRVAFLQNVGRIMRRSAGKTHGIVIDHAGAVFMHGFPDEDTEWTLEGNVDELFAQKQKEGATEKVLYCKNCELLYHGGPACPQCGKYPAKPPKSVFAPPPVEATDEVLTEAERGKDVHDKEQKVKHWLRCLAVAANRNGTFGMAGVIYKQKYNEFPGSDFPCVPPRSGWKTKVAEVYPKFRRAKQ